MSSGSDVSVNTVIIPLNCGAILTSSVASLRRSASIAPQFLRMMTVFTDTSSPELTHSLMTPHKYYIIIFCTQNDKRWQQINCLCNSLSKNNILIDGPGFRQNKSNNFFNQETLKLHNQKCHNAWSTFPLEGYFDKQ